MYVCMKDEFCADEEEGSEFREVREDRAASWESEKTERAVSLEKK